jgi:hypothetical protein
MFALILYNVLTGGLCSISDRSPILVFYNYFMDIIGLNFIMS